MHPKEEVGHLFRLGVFDLFEMSLYRLCAKLVATCRVHRSFIKRRDFVGIGAGLGIRGSKSRHDTAHAVVARIVEDVEHPVAGIFISEWVGFHPFLVDMVVEVSPCRNLLAYPLGIKAFEMLFGLSGKCEGTGGGQTERIT